MKNGVAKTIGAVQGMCSEASGVFLKQKTPDPFDLPPDPFDLPIMFHYLFPPLTIGLEEDKRKIKGRKIKKEDKGSGVF